MRATQKQTREATATIRNFQPAAPGDSILNSYVKQIRKIPLLSREEEIQVAIQAHSGDESARNRLVTSNLRFVAVLARKYGHHSLSTMDLINEGNMGLIRAAERFDPTAGHRFITYATSWIKQFISTAIHEKSSLIRVPINRMAAMRHFDELASENENDHTPRRGGIESRHALSIRERNHIANICREQLSLNAPIGVDGDLSLADVCADTNQTAPDSQMHDEDLRRSLNESMAGLSSRERNVLQSRFGLCGHSLITLERLSKRIGLSKERIRQIEKKAILKIRASRSARQLVAYLN